VKDNYKLFHVYVLQHADALLPVLSVRDLIAAATMRQHVARLLILSAESWDSADKLLLKGSIS
jgi:hypothetical protein